MTRSLYFIRENNTDTWCVSSRHKSFMSDFSEAAVFLKKKNADAAIKDMLNRIDPKKTGYPYWQANDRRYASDPDWTDERSAVLVPDFEVVEFTLTPVCK